MTRILSEATEEYLETVRPPADDLVEEMEAHAEADRIPIASRDVATLQAGLARATDADRGLEFGTAIGYSTLHVARTGCEVVTMEVDEERIAAAREYLDRGGVADRVRIHEAPALKVLPDLEGPFDVVFLDAVKTEYDDYLDGVLPMMPSGGMVVVDNMLWHGSVPEAVRTGEADDESTAALVEFNRAFVNHEDLQAVVTPLADGTGIGVKK
ncbi:O-methyltransferase [Halobacteriales archaeon QS_8_69_26]|nr:MAG: O-methyltransferase [Halobacteriales archaeon QS_8_69_26]